jgi:hypothetical protein
VFKEKERGYALLSVLLVFTIFMIIILAFIGRGLNSVKQNQVVEKSSQSVALAEMGITYYQAAVQNIYAANISTISDQVKQQIITDLQNKSLKSSDYYVQLGVSKMKDAIQSGLLTEKSPVSIDGRTNSTFSISSVDYFRTTQDNKIVIKVTGTENGKSTVLSSEMNFAPTVSGLDSSGNTLPPTFNSIIEPKTTDPIYCADPASIGTCKSILVTITPKTFTDKLNNSSNVTIYSRGVLTLDTPANANNMTNVKIHTENNLTIGGNVQNASSVTLEVKGNLTVNGQFKLQSATNVLVNGNVNIDKQLTLDSGSKMCVVGTIDSSKIHYKGGVLVEKNKVSASDWTAKCGTPATPEVIWGDEVNNNINYEY